METVWLLLVAVTALVALLWWRRYRAERRDRELDDARAEADRWYERLGGQVFYLGGEDPTVRQALADASERYVAAGSQIGQARTVRQYELARETAVEGLMYVRAARVALDLDPGPELPPLAAARGAGALTVPREVEVEGRTYAAGPERNDRTPLYYPGGRMQGHRIPAGWYSHPVWQPAAAGATASIVVLSALLAPSIPDPGYAGFDVDEGAAAGIPAGIADVTYPGGGFAEPPDVAGFDGGGFDGGGFDGGGFAGFNGGGLDGGGFG